MKLQIYGDIMYSTFIYILLIITISAWTYRKHVSNKNYIKYIEYLSNALLTLGIIIQLIFLIFFKRSFLISNDISKIILAIILLIFACLFKLINTRNKHYKFLHELSNQFLVIAVMLFIDGNMVPLFT